MTIRVKEFVADQDERARERCDSYNIILCYTSVDVPGDANISNHLLPAHTWKISAPERAATMSLVDAFHSRTSLTPNWAMLALKPRSRPSIDEKKVVWPNVCVNTDM